MILIMICLKRNHCSFGQKIVRNDKRKIFKLCIFIMAILSFVKIFQYSITYSPQWKLHMKYMGMLKSLYLGTGTLTSHLSDSGISGLSQRLASINSTQKMSGELEENHQGQNRSSINEPTATRNGTLCPINGTNLVGPIYVNQSIATMEDVEKEMSIEFRGWVRKGGSWKPTECQARVKMALIIPFRNRPEQLSIFVRHMHPFLKKQNLDYRIFVIEQAGNAPFNRAMLFNIGYKEALKFDEYECFIFHDVDLIPEDDRNEYSCPSSPRHLSVAIDTMHYRLKYKTLFGGAGSFSREHFELINGFSNIFWGWGGEDDNLYRRIRKHGLTLTRPAVEKARYKMLRLFHTAGTRPPLNLRLHRVKEATKRSAEDGLNSLKYTVQKLTEHRLYTLVTADVTEAMETK